MSDRPLVIITGPTAVGKTDISIQLAKKINGEIISADSMQVYRHMDIGTAKITPQEMDGVRHHLIDIMEPEESFNIAVFKEMADEAINDIYDRGKIPVIVGGTGFYIQSVLYDIDFTPDDGSDKYRKELEQLAAAKGADYMHELLRQTDPESAQAIHKNNVKRVIRALEYYKQTGQKMSEHNAEEKQKESAYNFAYFVLNDDREVLYDRINRRIDIMLRDGLVDEVRGLMQRGLDKNYVSMQGLGYKEIIDYLKGECTLEEAVYILKRDTRHFAKRQLTWFGHEKEVIYVNVNEFDRNKELELEYMLKVLKDKLIIKN